MRCASCHDDRPDPFLERCPDCDTFVHLDCWDELRRCPTFGCTRRPPAFPWLLTLGMLLVLAMCAFGPSNAHWFEWTPYCMGSPSRDTSQVLPDGSVRIETITWTETGKSTVWTTLSPDEIFETQVEVQSWDDHHVPASNEISFRASPPINRSWEAWASRLIWDPENDPPRALQRTVIEEVEWVPRRRRRRIVLGTREVPSSEPGRIRVLARRSSPRRRLRVRL